MWTVITALSLVTLATGLDLSEVGTCKSIEALNSANILEKFVTDEGGTWQYRLIPESDEGKTFSWMTMKVTKGQETGSYNLQTSYQIKSYKSIPQYKDKVKIDSSGQVVSANEDQKQILLKVLKYKPNEYVYIYRCVASGGKDGVDQRFFLAHDKLSEAAQTEMRALDQQHSFSGSLWNIV